MICMTSYLISPSYHTPSCSSKCLSWHAAIPILNASHVGAGQAGRRLVRQNKLFSRLSRPIPGTAGRDGAETRLFVPAKVTHRAIPPLPCYRGRLFKTSCFGCHRPTDKQPGLACPPLQHIRIKNCWFPTMPRRLNHCKMWGQMQAKRRLL